MIPANDFVKFRQVSENVMHVYRSVELPIYISIIIVNSCVAIVGIYVLYVAARQINCIHHLGKTWFAPLNGFSPVGLRLCVLTTLKVTHADY